MEFYKHIKLNKESYNKAEVEEMLHQTRCNCIIEESVRSEKAHVELKAFAKTLGL